MRRLLFPLICCSVLTACSGRMSAPVPDAPALAIVGVNVLPMTHDTVLRNQTVLIHGERIVAIDEASRVRIPRGAQIIFAHGRYLIPGLWDMHVHTLLSTDSARRNAALFLGAGVTGVRDMGSHLDSLIRIRARNANDVAHAPHLFAAGPLLDGPRQRWSHAFAWHLESPEQAQPAVDSLRRSGVDFLKVYQTLDQETYRALAGAARRAGIAFAGHVPFAVTAAEVSNAGQASVEHAGMDFIAGCVAEGTVRLSAVLRAWGGDGGFQAYYGGALSMREDRDAACWDDLLARYRRNTTRIVPTIVNEIKDGRLLTRSANRYLTPQEMEACSTTIAMIERADSGLRDRYFARFLADVRHMHEAGVPLMAGTDLGNDCIVAGFSLHEELAHFVDAGLTPFEALQTASVNPATFFGIATSLGTIQVGLLADVVLLEENPLADIRNTTKIAAVVRNGRWFGREVLDDMLSSVARPTATRIQHPERS